MTNTLYLDTETRNEKPLKPGVHKYAETVEVMMAQWSWNDDEAVEIVEFPDGQMLQELVDEADVIVMHNSMFDRTVLREALGVDIPIHKIHDTMAQALAHGLPAGLAQLCAALGIEGDAAKDARGKKLIQLFCKPRPKNQKLRWATKATHPVEWQWLCEYGGSDIIAMRNAYKKMPRWNYPDNPREYALWCLDQTINDRGISVDTVMASAAVDAAAAVRKYLNEKVAEDTDGAITNLRQRDPFLEHILTQFGIDLPDLTKATLERRLEDPSLPDEVKELLRARLFASAASVAKYKSVLASVCLDGRLRGTLQFCGAARTGRWAGRLFQPQNIPRTSKKWKKIVKRFIHELVSGAVDLIYDPKDVMDGLVNALRGVLVAAPGHKLVASDLSNIEGRMLAWLAGETWKLKAFARGDDLYILGYAASFGVPVGEVVADEAAGGIMRLIGKVQELACIAEGQKVLTDKGLVPIERITTEHLLWDGVEFVAHDGVVFRGVKDTVEYDGVVATPDHIVFTDHGEMELGLSAACGARLVRSGSGRTPVRVGGDYRPGQTLPQKVGGRICADALHGVRSLGLAGHSEPSKREEQRVPSLLTTQARSEMVRTKVLRCFAALQKCSLETVHLLRRKGGRVSVRLSNRNGRMGVRELGSTTGQRAGSHRQRWPLRAGKSSVGFEGGQHPQLSYRGAARVFDILNAGPRNRFTANGRLVHNCGYQGAVGAFRSMAAVYGLELSEARILEIVKGWRKANKRIVSFWYDLEDAAKKAIELRGKAVECRRLKLVYKNGWLNIRLPSGRLLSYPSAKIVDGKITYMGVNQYSRKWERLTTYGGKLVENCTQAAARDVIAHNMQAAEDAGFSLLMSVHDELVSEVPVESGLTSDHLSAILATNPPWAEGLPLAAEGFEDDRYRK